MTTTLRTLITGAGLTLALGACSNDDAASITIEHPDPAHTTAAAVEGRAVEVNGEAVHYFSTAAIHSQLPSEGGMVQRSTDVIRLTGDIDGWVLYHPTSVFDYAEETLVNTGTQFFSGTVLGSDPVVLHDDTFRFDVDLASGETRGRIHLGRSSDAPHTGSWYECTLTAVGTGFTPEGDGLATYSGTCSAFGRARGRGVG